MNEACPRQHTRDEAVRRWDRERARLAPSLHEALDDSSARLEASLAAESLNPFEEAARNEELAQLAEALV